uniref:Uncharacterized protein n=1 Tax=Salmonella phage SalP219 TaxID=3158864 RepID=A0AAU7PHR2_9CAUD
MISISSKPLYEFYKEYTNWLYGESFYKFSRRVGLCANSWDYEAAYE